MKRPDWKDPRGRHIRLYAALVDSPAWNCLTATDQRVYVALRRALGPSNNGDLSLPLSRARHYGIGSPATLAKSLRALVAVGLIAVTHRVGCTRGGQRLPTLYRVTDEQVFPMAPKLIEACRTTDDWKNVSSIAVGKSLIAAAEAAARESAESRRLLQKLNATATSSEAVKALTDTKIEAWRPRPLRMLNRAKPPPDAGIVSADRSLGAVDGGSA